MRRLLKTVQAQTQHESAGTNNKNICPFCREPNVDTDEEYMGAADGREYALESVVSLCLFGSSENLSEGLKLGVVNSRLALVVVNPC